MANSLNANLIDVDLPEPVRVVMSDEGVRTFPKYRWRAGVARNCVSDPDLIRIKPDGQTQYKTMARSFWRLAQ